MTIDWILDGCFLLLGIAGTVLVIIKHKRFDKGIALFACAAWICKGVRLLGYDYVHLTINHMKNEEVYLFLQKASSALQVLDALVGIFLFVALVRLAILASYTRWYKKQMQAK